jgi:hypothetical protein
VLLDPVALVAAVIVYVTRWHWPDLVFEIVRLDASYWRTDNTQAHQIILMHALYALLDAPYFLCAAATVLTFWRLPVLIKRLWKQRQRQNVEAKRKASLQQFVCGLLDIPCLVCRIVIRLLRWNTAQLDAALLPFWGPSARGRNGLRYHTAVFGQFAVLLADTPYLLAIGFIALTLWRLPTLVRMLRAPPGQQNGANAAQLHHFGGGLADKRSVVLRVLSCVLLDVPAFLAYLAVRFTVWHYSDMQQRLTVRARILAHAHARTHTHARF